MGQLTDASAGAKGAADKAKSQIDTMKAQLAAKDVVIADLQAQLAEVPQAVDLMQQIKAELS